MVNLSELLGNAKRQDLIRIANSKPLPKRGRKKHVSQMDRIEVDYLFKRLRGVHKWGLIKHSLDRMKEKKINVTYQDIVSTIHKSRLIEYHRLDNEERVLVRSNATVNIDKNLNVVYSLTNKKVISVWLNDINDKHSTIDMADYDSSVKILEA